MPFKTIDRRAISRIASVVVIVVILILAAVGVYYYASQVGTTSTQSSSSTATTSSQTATTTAPTSSSTTTTTTSTSTATTTTTATSTSIGVQALVVEDLTFGHTPYAGGYPGWGAAAVWQTLIGVNLTAEQNFGQITFVPVLASNWTISPDGTTFNVSLRHGVTFSDGNAFNSYAVWADFYLTYYLSGNFSSFWSLLPLFNLTAVNFGPATISLMSQSGMVTPSSQLISIMSNQSWPVYVNGPDTIVFRMVGPYVFFPNSFSFGVAEITDPTFVFQNGGPGTPSTPNSYFVNNPPPGTGPYMVTNVVPSSSIEFHQNPSYWGASLNSAEVAANPVLDPGHFSTIIVQFKASDTTRYIDLTTGKAHISAVVGSNYQLVQSNPAYGLASFNYPATQVYLAMNTKVFPTNITDVRQAIVHAINYTGVIDQAVFGQGIQYVGPETPSYGSFYNPGNLPPYGYNVTEAKTLLSNAGYANGSGLPSMTFIIDSAGISWEEPAAELIQQDLAAVGINVNIQVIPTGVFYGSTAFAYPYDTNVLNPTVEAPLSFNGYAGYAPDYLGPPDYWSAFVSNSSLFGNQAIYNSPAVDTALDLMTHSNNISAILAALTVAQQQVYNDAPYAWMFVAKLPFIDGSYAYSKSVVGGFYLDYDLMGLADIPILNTITAAM